MRMEIYRNAIIDRFDNTVDDISLRILVLLNPNNMFLSWSIEDLFSTRNPTWFHMVALKYMEGA